MTTLRARRENNFRLQPAGGIGGRISSDRPSGAIQHRRKQAAGGLNPQYRVGDRAQSGMLGLFIGQGRGLKKDTSR